MNASDMYAGNVHYVIESALFCSSSIRSKPTWLHPEELKFKTPKVLLSHIELNAYKPANEKNCILVNPTCNVARADTINLGYINFQKLLAGGEPVWPSGKALG